MNRLEELRRDKRNLKDMIEVKEKKIEALTNLLRLAREDRTRYREQLGNLLSAIDEWKKKSGLY